VGDLGYAQELGNYGEYSGAPNTNETYSYAKTVLECVTANPDGRGRALLIGGGIANFTGGRRPHIFMSGHVVLVHLMFIV
jgi:ATP citrate (pro-S)-lyase